MKWAVCLVALSTAGCLQPPAGETPAGTSTAGPPSPAETLPPWLRPPTAWTDAQWNGRWPRGPCDTDADIPPLAAGRWPTIVPHDGDGTVVLELEPEALSPGQNLSFQFRFTNPDCHTFLFGRGDCTHGTIEIGSFPLLVIGPANPAHLRPLQSRNCPDSESPLAVPPGGTHRVTSTWNGSVVFLDHALAEAGRQLQPRTFWFGPGLWDLGHGFPEGSYPTRAHRDLAVLENDLNRESPLRPGECIAPDASGRAGWPTDVELNATAQSSAIAASLGTVVTIWFNYTIPTPTGCRLLEGAPTLRVDRPGGSPPPLWMMDRGPVLVHSDRPSVFGHLTFTYDGRSVNGEAAPCVSSAGEINCDPATGTDTVWFEYGPFLRSRSVNITWTPP